MRAAVDPQCLICLETDGGFTSVEHPIPESIGNTTIVLPVGVVCDRCNGGELSVLDQDLAEFFPIKLQRTRLGIASKAGKIPVTRFQDGVFEHNGVLAALHGSLSPKTWTEEGRSRVVPRYTVGLATLTGGRRLTQRYAERLSRAVLKVGFECAWEEQRDVLLDRAFDDVRGVIRGSRRRAGYLFVGSEVNERNTGINVRFEALCDSAGNTSLFVVATFYGVMIVTDSRAEAPPPMLTPDLGVTITF